MVERATFTNEAQFAEASRYVNSPSFFMGGRDLSSSTPSRFGRTVAKGGSLGKLASVNGREEQNPLSIILANGRTWEMVSEGRSLWLRREWG